MAYSKLRKNSRVLSRYGQRLLSWLTPTTGTASSLMTSTLELLTGSRSYRPTANTRLPRIGRILREPYRRALRISAHGHTSRTLRTNSGSAKRLFICGACDWQLIDSGRLLTTLATHQLTGSRSRSGTGRLGRGSASKRMLHRRSSMEWHSRGCSGQETRKSLSSRRKCFKNASTTSTSSELTRRAFT